MSEYPYTYSAGVARLTVHANTSQGTVTVHGKDPFTNKRHEVTVGLVGFENWRSGELIQKALPLSSASDREFLISGMTDESFDAATRDVEDEATP